MHKITIVGAGVSGLTAAYLLKQKGIDTQILEARKRIGGRTKTMTSAGVSIDLGAAWIWPHHQHITTLVEELKLETYPQYESGYGLLETPSQIQAFETQASNYSRRLKNGTQEISQQLAQHLKGQIKLNTKITSIQNHDDHVSMTTSTGETIKTKQVIIAMPPRVIAKMIHFKPSLPTHLQQAQDQTHTWMGNSAKAIITYATPFWRNKQLSGAAISYLGPLGELHDNSPEDASKGIIKGFFAGIHRFSGSQAQRKQNVITQLTKLYGTEAQNPIDYQEKAWWKDELSSAAKDHLPLKEHPHYGNPELSKAYWNNKLYFAGAETATQQGGYLDGAVEAAKRVSEQILREHADTKGTHSPSVTLKLN